MQEEIIELKKDLFCCLIGLARACENIKVSKDTYLIIINALISLLPNVTPPNPPILSNSATP